MTSNDGFVKEIVLEALIWRLNTRTMSVFSSTGFRHFLSSYYISLEFYIGFKLYMHAFSIEIRSNQNPVQYLRYLHSECNFWSVKFLQQLINPLCWLIRILCYLQVQLLVNFLSNITKFGITGLWVGAKFWFLTLLFFHRTPVIKSRKQFKVKWKILALAVEGDKVRQVWGPGCLVASQI